MTASLVQLENLSIIGAVPYYNPVNAFFPSPIFAQHNPPQLKNSLWQGYHSATIEHNTLILEENFAGQIRVGKQPSIYIGGQNYLNALLFEEPIQFEQGKQLVFARQPNQTPLQNAIAQYPFQGNIYYLLYENIKTIQTGTKEIIKY